MSSCVVRIRPAAQSYAGRSLSEAEALAAHLGPGAAVSAFDVEFLLDMPLDYSELEDMAQTLVDGTTSSDVVLVEADFRTRAVPRSYQVLDSLISGLLSQDSVIDSACHIVVLLNVLPNRVDQVHDLLDIPNISQRILIADTAGNHLGSDHLVHSLTALLDAHPNSEEDVKNSILRHRGVFRSRSAGRLNNHVFYYEALPKAIGAFQASLVRALSEIEPHVVVFDTSSSGAWFSSMVQAACVELQSDHGVTLSSIDAAQWESYHVGTLVEPHRSRVEAASEILSRTDSSVAVIVPAYASGRSLTGTMELVGVTDLTRCTAIAVFAESSVRLEPSSLPGTSGRARQPYGGKSLSVHCLLQVELRTLAKSEWLVEAAEVLGQVRDLPLQQMDHPYVHDVALWSLYADCGVGYERLPPRGRPPKRYFPDLARLDAWDAHWLAEAAVRLILDRLPKSNRAALLIVLPAEANGIQPISQALLEKCRVAVLPVPRDMIEAETPVTGEILKKLRRHTADTIVVLDESTVTHGTLGRLVGLIESNIRVRPDLAGAVIDMSGQPVDLGIPFFSLTGWAAITEGVNE